MAENNPTENEQFEINPDGADLDGTAEIERQKGEENNEQLEVGVDTGDAQSVS
ncbi:MAG: hypothetical protein ABI868_10070 [Acidobacteriota bacterium]